MIEDRNGEKNLRKKTYKKKKKNQKQFRVEEVINRKSDKVMSNGKDIIILVNIELIKKTVI